MKYPVRILAILCLLAICNASAMDSSIDTIPFGTFSRKRILLDDQKEVVAINAASAQNPLQQLDVRDEYEKKLYDILWKQLDPLPKELIQMILSYVPLNICYTLAHTLKGVYLRDALITLPNNRCASIKNNQLCIIDCNSGTTVQQATTSNTKANLRSLLGITDNNIILVALKSAQNKDAVELYNYKTKTWLTIIPTEELDHFVQLSKNFIALAQEGGKQITLLQTAPTRKQHKALSTVPTLRAILDLAKASQEQGVLAVLTEDSYKENSIELYNWKTWELVKKFGTGQNKALAELANNLLITINGDAGHKDWLTLWNGSTGQALKTIEFKDSTLNHMWKVAQTPNNLLIIIPGTIAAASKTGGHFFLANPKTGTIVQEFKTPTSIHAAHATNNFIITMGTYGMIQIWKKTTSV